MKKLASMSLRAEISELQTQLKKSQEKEVALNKKLSASSKQLDELQKDYKALIYTVISNDDIKSDVTRTDTPALVIEHLQASIKSKDKQISDLEDEVSDLGDEISSLKEKNKDIKEKCTSAESELFKANKELSETKSTLIEYKSEIEGMSTAIDFVNTILTASNVNDTDALKKAEQINRIRDIVLDQYITLLHEIEVENELIEERKLGVYKWTNLQNKTWLNDKKVIAIIGEFSAGKTSIVNRILSQDDPDCPKLPVSSKATTAIATYISYGEDFRSQFTDGQGNLKNIPRDYFEQVNKDILSKVKVSSSIKYFVMSYKNENLKGISILDTPGFSSNDQEDQERTLDVIREADALLWVVDAQSGDINRSSLSIISENIQNLPLYIVINKVDTKSPNEIEELETHIKKTLKKNNINVEGYIRFSREQNVDQLIRVIQSIEPHNTESTISDICWDLQSTINECKTKKKKNQSLVRDIKDAIKEKNDNIDNSLIELGINAEDVIKIPQFKERNIFHAEEYRMSTDDFNELKELCEAVHTHTDYISRYFKSYGELNKVLAEKENDYNENNELLLKSEHILNNLLKAVKSYSPSLKENIIAHNADSRHNENVNFRVNEQENPSIEGSQSIWSQIEQKLKKARNDDLTQAKYCIEHREYIEAFKWIKQAADYGNKTAKDIIKVFGGLINKDKPEYESLEDMGEQIEDNWSRILISLNKSSDEALIQAKNLVKRCSYNEAEFWIKKAAKDGNNIAKEILKTLK